MRGAQLVCGNFVAAICARMRSSAWSNTRPPPPGKLAASCQLPAAASALLSPKLHLPRPRVHAVRGVECMVCLLCCADLSAR